MEVRNANVHLEGQEGSRKITITLYLKIQSLLER
jgi:hypothetical protein